MSVCTVPFSICKCLQSSNLSCQEISFCALVSWAEIVFLHKWAVLSLPAISDCSTLLRAVIHPRRRITYIAFLTPLSVSWLTPSSQSFGLYYTLSVLYKWFHSWIAPSSVHSACPFALGLHSSVTFILFVSDQDRTRTFGSQGNVNRDTLRDIQ